MRELVGDDLGLRTPRRCRRVQRVDEEQDVPERDEPGVLHRPGGEVGDGDEVELRVRVAHVEVLAELVDEGRGHVERDAGEARAALGRDDANGERLLAAFGHVEVAHREGDEISGEGRRRRERVEECAVGGGGDRLRLRGVGEGDQPRGRGDRHLVRRLEARLVEAGERAPGVRGLELGVGVPAALLLDAVEAREVGREGGVVRDLEGRRPRGEGLREFKHQLLGHHAAAREPRRHPRNDLDPAGARHRTRYRHLSGIEHHGVRGLGQVDLDRGGPGEARLRGVDGQRHVVMLRDRRRRESAVFARGWGRGVRPRRIDPGRLWRRRRGGRGPAGHEGRQECKGRKGNRESRRRAGTAAERHESHGRQARVV